MNKHKNSSCLPWPARHPLNPAMLVWSYHAEQQIHRPQGACGFIPRIPIRTPSPVPSTCHSGACPPLQWVEAVPLVWEGPPLPSPGSVFSLLRLWDRAGFICGLASFAFWLPPGLPVSVWCECCEHLWSRCELLERACL